MWAPAEYGEYAHQTLDFSGATRTIDKSAQMSNRAAIVVRLPRNRDVSGRLFVYDRKGLELVSFEVLGRGSKGPGDTSLKKDGNTPTGSYDASTIVDTGSWNEKSYGRFGAIRLKPLGGNALVAAEVFGRDGLLIHGGELGAAGYWRGEGSLRATHGCLRLRNNDIRRLIGTIRGLHIDKYDPLCWAYVTVDLEVLESG